MAGKQGKMVKSHFLVHVSIAIVTDFIAAKLGKNALRQASIRHLFLISAQTVQRLIACKINYRMRVTLNDGRQMTGQMLAFDKVGSSFAKRLYPLLMGVCST